MFLSNRSMISSSWKICAAFRCTNLNLFGSEAAKSLIFWNYWNRPFKNFPRSNVSLGTLFWGKSLLWKLQRWFERGHSLVRLAHIQKKVNVMLLKFHVFVWMHWSVNTFKILKRKYLFAFTKDVLSPCFFNALWVYSPTIQLTWIWEGYEKMHLWR